MKNIRAEVSPCSAVRVSFACRMPELAEVEFYRQRWAVGHGAKVSEVLVHGRARVFRHCDPSRLQQDLRGRKLLRSSTAAKQMLFQFSGGVWVGLHLAMSGELRVEPADYAPAKHDHLVLRQARRSLVFTDPRMFGAVRFHSGQQPPAWWTGIAPAILSDAFTLDAVAEFLRRRRRTPLKAALLMQERFPGVGNWMADEILWRAGLHPQRLAGLLGKAETKRLRRECRTVCRHALRVIAGVGSKLPASLNLNIPDTWLFNHRWQNGDTCPRCDQALQHAPVGGRTSCWCPACQPVNC